MSPHPLTLSEWKPQREVLLRALSAWCGPIPRRRPPDVIEHARTEFRRYTEVKISYADEVQARIPAYLLVPRYATTERLPAIVAAHQCAWACDIGKEQVVGKCVEWPDQAYGLELVQRGFVVIAPDANKVGERFDPALRQRWQTAADLGGSQQACCTAPEGRGTAGGSACTT